MGTASHGRKYTDERLDGGEGFNIFKDIFTEGKAESAINWPLLTSFFPLTKYYTDMCCSVTCYSDFFCDYLVKERCSLSSLCKKCLF